MNQNINTLMKKLLLGTATEEEKAELVNSAEHDVYQEIIQSNDLVDRYRQYAQLDEDTAYKEMLKRIGREEATQESGTKKPSQPNSLTLRAVHTSFLKYAAAIVVLVIAGAGYWYSQYTKVTPPEIPEAVQLAMQQSIERGKQDALSEKLRVKSEEYLGKKDNEDGVLSEGEESPAKNSSLFTLHSSLNITSSLTKEQLLAARRITTKHDKEYWVTLDDGTLVHLNYNTRLIYPEKFGRGNRNVILDGEAYFMVAKDRSRPFIVHTPNGDVKVYGTEFNVNTRSEDTNAQPTTLDAAATSVVLVKGKVSVTPTGGKETMLRPGQKFSMLNTQCSIEEVDVNPYIAWNLGYFVFENCTLKRLMDVLSKWYGYDVEYLNEKTQDIKFTGELDKYGTIEPLIEAIEQVTGLDISLKNHTIVIKK